MSKCFDCKERFELNELHLIKAPTLNGRAWQCQPCHVLELKRIRDINQSIHAGKEIGDGGFIDRARALDKAATEGPWGVEGSLFGPAHAGIGQAWGLNWRRDLEFTATARSMLPAAVEALARVRKLHTPTMSPDHCPVCIDRNNPEFYQEHPCDTYQATEVTAEPQKRG